MSRTHAPVLDPGDLERLGAIGDPFLKVRLKLATPMIGGGALAGQPDPHWPIRSSAVRGHLRFWWRATAGAAFSTAAEMRKAEAELWGSTECAAKLLVRVRLHSSEAPFTIIPNGGVPPQQVRQALEARHIPAYALGPLNTRETLATLKLIDRCEFTVELAFSQTGGSDSARAQAEVAVLLWALCGGVGARSRRGFGCLEPADSAANELFVRPLRPPGSPGQLGERITHVHGARTVHALNGTSALVAWNETIRLFHSFRRAEIPGCTRPWQGGNSHTGWPEANAIRRFCGVPELTPPGPVLAPPFCFPRGQLGLPLHFGSMRDHAGFFGGATLRGCTEGRQRLASSVICKPIRINGGWRAGMTLLVQPTPGEDDLELLVEGEPAGTRLSLGDAASLPRDFYNGNGPARRISLGTSVSDTLRLYLTEQANWVEVS